MALCEFVLRTIHSCALFFFFRNNPVLKPHQQSMLHNNLSNPEGFSAVQYCRVFKFLKARIFLYEELIATYVVARWLSPLYELSFGLIRLSFLVKRWMLIESHPGQCMISSARMFLRTFIKNGPQGPFYISGFWSQVHPYTLYPAPLSVSSNHTLQMIRKSEN